jgi:hypothetical protein
VLAAGKAHDVVDRQEIRLVLEMADQLQFVLDLFLHGVRDAVREPPMRPDVRFLPQIRLVCKAWRNELVGIFVFEFIQRESAALEHAQCFGQRVLGIQVRETQARAQVLLGIGRQIVAALRDGFAKANGRHRVLQRLSRPYMHDDVTRGHHRNQVARGKILDRAPMDIVHGALMQGQTHPRPSGKRRVHPFELRGERLFLRREIRDEDRQAIRHAAQVRVGRLWTGDVLRC